MKRSKVLTRLSLQTSKEGDPVAIQDKSVILMGEVMPGASNHKELGLTTFLLSVFGDVVPLTVVLSTKEFEKIFFVEGKTHPHVKSTLYLEGQFRSVNLGLVLNRKPGKTNAISVDRVDSFYFAPEDRVVYGSVKGVVVNPETDPRFLSDLVGQVIPHISVTEDGIDRVVETYRKCVMHAGSLLPMIERTSGCRLDNRAESLMALSTTIFINSTRK